MTSLQEISRTQLLPFEAVDIQHLAKLLAAEWQEWLEGDSQVSCQLQADVQDGLTTLGISLPNLPRLAFCDIAIADTSQVHSLELGIAELELLQQSLNLSLYILKLLKSLLIYILQFATSRNHTIPILLGELEGTIHKVAINSYELVVITILEILPSEVIILSLRSVGCQYIAQYILLARHIYQILVEPYSPVA